MSDDEAASRKGKQEQSGADEQPNIMDSDAVVTDSEGRTRFRTLRVNKGGGDADDKE